MKNVRKWGEPPYRVAVVHGGPGAPGAVAPVARELSRDYGVLEPLQTKDSIDGQVEELAEVLKEHGNPPVSLIGHSWGATLSYITASRFPDIVNKLILIGMPALEAGDRPDLTRIWLERFSEAERVEFLSLEESVWDGKDEDKSSSMRHLFRLIARAESYDPLPLKDEVLEYQLDINVAIFRELLNPPTSLDLISVGQKIECPVIAIHGDYDARPAENVRESLSCAHEDFKFILLEKCGHTPWLEKYARERFFEVLRKEIE